MAETTMIQLGAVCIGFTWQGVGRGENGGVEKRPGAAPVLDTVSSSQLQNGPTAAQS